MTIRFFGRAFLVLILSSTFRFGAFGQTNGIFADFTTSMGSFTCRLEYAIAPKAVANFMGLATGQRPWLDLPSGVARTNPFYNGLLFHRVVAGFVIQAGSPNGQGTDGPGYIVPDEISPLLRFNNTGILAMANTGTNSNGSQFFITVTNTPFLNDGYTIFGELAGGTNVVIAISRVATNANSKPLTNVVIQNVAIRRVGTAAQVFDINAQNLPVVTNLPLKIAGYSGQVLLTYSNRLYADSRLYTSTNLTTWTPNLLGIEIALPITNTITGPSDGPSRFFSMAQVQYPSSTFAPKNVLGRQMILNFSSGGGTITNNFNAVGGGMYSFRSGTTTSQGTIVGYAWFQEPYRGNLSPIYFSALVPMQLTLNFTGTAGGIFNGTAYPDPPDPSFPVSGTFSLN
jgi:peptidyl-prolyl cis-trans isomerase A (cyclophilin A)